MKNWGQKPRKIRIKKRYTISPFVLNLTEEANRCGLSVSGVTLALITTLWAELSKVLRKKVRQ